MRPLASSCIPTATVAAIVCSVLSAASAAESARTFSIGAGPAEQALKAYATQSGQEVVFATATVSQVTTNAVQGSLTPTAALDRLLQGTGLVATKDAASGTLSVTRGTAPNAQRAVQAPGADRPSAPAAPALPGADVIEMSPFVVDMGRDTGYHAENTLAGSRLNTSLRDTASSVSVFTREFLDDTAITDVSELLKYSVNGEMFTNDNQPGFEQNPVINAQSLTPGVLIRGQTASLGMDYFTSIMPIDPYRAARFEDSRGPNSILFGIGSPGGIINQTSKIAQTGRDTAQARYSLGSWDRSRAEFDANKVLIKGKAAISIAALDQENGGWRDWDFQDKERLFGSVTLRPTRNLTFTAMGETGRDIGAVIRATVDSDSALAWYDNREARGVGAVTFTPNNTAPTAAMQALGVTARDVAASGNNHRVTYIENDGTIFDARGTFLTGSYNNAAVRHPDGTPGVTAGTLRIHDPRMFPLHLNAAGPGMNRQQSIRNMTLSLDWQVTRELSLNLAHNYQRTRALVTLISGSEPFLRGDPNRTLGVNGVANPYAGRLYYEGTWRQDEHVGEVRETRVSASYNFDTKSKWLGRHRLAAMASMQDTFDTRVSSILAMAGRPFNNTPNNANNLVAVRYYLTEGDYGTYRMGDHRKVPSTIDFQGRSYPLIFANAVAGANNSGGEQEGVSALAVLQSYFFNDKLVTTFGFRRDRADIIELGYYSDPIQGDIVDRDRSKATVSSATADTGSAGVVFHALPWLSLVANTSSNKGLPSFSRKVLPDGRVGSPSEGEGSDYGLNLELLEGRVNARLVYFQATEMGRLTTIGFSGTPGRNTRVSDALAGVLVGAGRPYSAAEWAPIYAALNPPATNAAHDLESEGYEARITANLTKNWRLIANYSYTDTRRTNIGREVTAWYGLTGTGSRYTQGVRQDSSGRFVVDPAAYSSDGTVAKWLALAAQRPEANVSTLTTSNGRTIAEEIYDIAEAHNETNEENEQRWGLRPHKVSLFTAYDFKEGWLRGFTAGGGWRWRSANIIGRNSSGGEMTGRSIIETDLLLAYSTKIARIPGRFRFQVNVTNLLDKTDIIPVRLASSDSAPYGFTVPGGRGVAYSRYDLVTPREIRFTTTWSY
ncbi:MAG TPA: TonB-dependent receptor plug domain-containing protein [Opitutaceae bacterium]